MVMKKTNRRVLLGEDHKELAETVVAWVGLRCKPERIKKSDFEKVSEVIKNRLKFIDNFAAKKL